MSKRPSFQFYPSDWRKESGLRLCSMAARGLWAEMLCLMHEGEPYGYLTYQGRPIEPRALARLVGENPANIKRWLSELADNNVYSVDNGIILSRRMVRDEDLRERRAAGGSAGGEHGYKGRDHGAKGGRPRKEKTPVDEDGEGFKKPPLKPAPSSSSSSSASQESPVADATGANVDPEKVMFDQGLRLLKEAGVTEARARPMLGRWKRDHGAELVIVALGKAQREGAIDPISFIEGCFRNGGFHGNRPRNAGEPEDDRTSGSGMARAAARFVAGGQDAGRSG